MAIAKKKTKRARTSRGASSSRTGALAVVFGDQLDAGAPLLDGLDRKSDVVLLAEVRGESTDPPSHRQRTILFLSAMRHFARDLRRRGFEVRYVEIDDPDNSQTLRGEIEPKVNWFHKLKRTVQTIWREGMNFELLRNVAAFDRHTRNPQSYLEDHADEPGYGWMDKPVEHYLDVSQPLAAAKAS